ncbi:secretin N-terminal domain-containing protein [Alkalimarinus coralli]|uniref:secretin N-terminal domain-containing protein n=1 Tax=Alkalimarinus coralli TaxID=2935863 RepID=UPI00202B5B88|nr:secretin N-terminal domain-containing protein [Alkalimarinus coralli]
MKFSRVKTASRPLVRSSLVLILFILSASVLAQTVEVISIQHRSAEDIAQQVKALYPEQELRIVGHNKQLTVRASAPIVDEVKQLVSSLDTPPHQFLISISNDMNHKQLQSGISGAASISTNSASSNGVKISAHNKTYQTRGSGNQTVRAVEGHSAYISAGQKRPVRGRQLVNGQWVNSVDYIDMTRGFYVQPRLIGESQVELKIRSQQNRSSKQHYNEIDTTTVETIQVVRLGEWVSIGGSSTANNNHQSGISYSTQRQSVEDQNVTIKVELVTQ